MCSILAAPQVVAFDFSRGSLGVSRASGIHPTSSIQGTALGLPFATASMDLVVSCQVLQHLRPAEAARAVQEIARVLAPGKAAAIAAYNRAYLGNRWTAERSSDSGLYGRWFSPSYLQSLARPAGLAVERIQYYRTLPLRRLRSSAWLGAERAVAHVPVLNRLLGAYLFAVLRKPSSPDRA